MSPEARVVVLATVARLTVGVGCIRRGACIPLRSVMMISLVDCQSLRAVICASRCLSQGRRREAFQPEKQTRTRVEYGELEWVLRVRMGMGNEDRELRIGVEYGEQRHGMC